MRSLFLAATLLTLTACATDPGKGKVAAEVEEVPTEQVTTPAAPAGKELAVDTSKSSIKALGAKVTAQHPIIWHSWNGSVTVDGNTLTGVSFSADMASLEADHEDLTAHLKNEDFFEVEKFPKATFKSASITEGSDAEGDWTHTVAGDFTIRGVTKRLTFPAKISVTDGEVTANTEFVMNRKDFGITYPGMPDNLIKDNVKMTISFVAPRA